MFKIEKKKYRVTFVDDNFIYVDDIIEKINWRKVKHYSINAFLLKNDDPYVIVTYAILGKMKWIKSISLYFRRRSNCG